MIDEETEGIFSDEVLGGVTVRSRTGADRLAGLPIAQAALKFASARHANQYRALDHAPFIAHLIEVGWLLRCDGRSDEVIAAGLLHDVLEKTDTTSAELQRRFGVRIAQLVETVSDDPSIGDYKERKSELRDRIAHAASDTRAIFAADKISKIRELALLPPWLLDEPKARAKLAHYRASLEMLRRVAADIALVDRLDADLNRIMAPTATGPHGARASTTGSKRSEHRAPEPETSSRA